MSLVDVDSWLTEYEACERLSHDIQSQIVLRDRENRLSEEYSKISATARIRLKQYTTELQQLSGKLEISSRSGNLTVEELERRQRQIEALQSKRVQLENKFKNTRSVERESLLSPGASRLWEDDDDVPIIDTSSYNVEDLRRQQIQILEDQNQGLDALSQTISRQKQLASRLGEEVEEQNEIIDDLADTIERTDARVNSETRHVTLIGRQDKTWGYWVIIVVLFVAIIIVAVI